jgi:hypothetical protein
MSTNEEEDEYEKNIREILEELVFRTIKNQPKNIVSIFKLILKTGKIYCQIINKKRKLYYD